MENNEHELYKCSKHPSRRRRTGICPTCLRDRLSILCPDCAHARPCACPTTSFSSTTSSSSLSSSFSTRSFFSDGGGVGRVGNLIDSEPAFLRRSRSLSVPFLKTSAVSFWSVLRLKKKKKKDNMSDVHEHEHEQMCYSEMRRSKSVAVERGTGKGNGPNGKLRDFHFPSPMKVLRLSSKILGHHRQSPLYRS